MSPLDLLREELKRIHALEEIGGLLGWDEQVNLPEKSQPFRAKQNEHFAALLHRETTSARLGGLIETAAESLTPDAAPADRADVMKAQRDYERSRRLPESYVAAKAKLDSEAFHAWVKARKEATFDTFAPYLERQLELAKREPEYTKWDGESDYDYWVDRFDPGFSTDRLDEIVAPLMEKLPSLASDLTARCARYEIVSLRGFPEGEQEKFLREILVRMGFDFGAGRLDRSTHPFCGGCGWDTRLTTRYDPDNPLDSLFSAIHEAGHGLYEQGLPKDRIGLASGSAAGMAAHESQSRLWENLIGRSPEFWTFWEPRYREAFSQQLRGIDSETLIRAINRVGLTQIRVDSDEVTYNLHILIRYELEKALFAGELAVKDLPEAWNATSAKYLGAAPGDDREGVLQDVHWSAGAFGYFPSYLVGNLIAAQLWATLRRQVPRVDADIRDGDYQRILLWLRQSIHLKGQTLLSFELIQEVTGKPLDSTDFVDYLERRYTAIFP